MNSSGIWTVTVRAPNGLRRKGKIIVVVDGEQGEDEEDAAARAILEGVLDQAAYSVQWIREASPAYEEKEERA